MTWRTSTETRRPVPAEPTTETVSLPASSAPDPEEEMSRALRRALEKLPDRPLPSPRKSK